MLKDKPIISNQYGALVMAFVPFLYGIFASGLRFEHLWLGLSWLFLYLFSYPFFALFTKNNKQRYQKWAAIYLSLSTLFAFPLLLSHFSLLQFCVPILPLAAIQMHYEKQKDERNLINDIAGILTFGVVGMASFYLATHQYNIEMLLHPTLFFIATTLYVKSVARERKNPRYLHFSLSAHLCLGIIYFGFQYYPIALAYLVGLIRAIVVPKKNLKIKQVGMLEFAVVLIFTLALWLS